MNVCKTKRDRKLLINRVYYCMYTYVHTAKKSIDYGFQDYSIAVATTETSIISKGTPSKKYTVHVANCKKIWSERPWTETEVYAKLFRRSRDILRWHSHISSVVSFEQWSGTKLRAWHPQRFPEMRKISRLLWISFKHFPRCLCNSLSSSFFPRTLAWDMKQFPQHRTLFH